MLAKANRLVRADDYRRTVRRGRRISTEHMIVYVTQADSLEKARFGFIVSKSVGVAVRRNLVRRRLKAASYESLAGVKPGTDIVIRALPGAAQASWATLRSEISEVLNRGVTRV